MAYFLSIAKYPLITSAKMSGVVPVENPTEKPDPTMEYKLLFELTYNNPDSMAKELNDGLAEIGRVINLHVASGIPAEKIIPVVVVHGSALYSVMNNEAYQKKYACENPNLQLIAELEQKAVVKFIACGQAMAFFQVDRSTLPPEFKVSLTAQTVLSNYQTKNYVLYVINTVK